MNIKILKSGKWGLTHIGPIIEIIEGCVEIVCKERIHKELAEKMIAAGWAEEIYVKEEIESDEVEIPQETTTETQDVNIKVDQSTKPKRRRPFKGRR
jgi:hypothetical protein